MNSTSAAQLAANRANAQLSTGPNTPEGKSKVSLNAVKTGLTGRTVLLPSEDAALYERHILAYQEEFQPVGQHEADLVQSIADSAWRLGRIPGLELAIYARGHVQFANDFDSFDAALRPSLIDLHIATVCEKQLRNLHLQEARLHRRREKDLAELRQLQKDRKEEEKRKRAQALEAAAKEYYLAKHEKRERKNGFEFSVHEIEDFLGRMSTVWINRLLAPKAA